MFLYIMGFCAAIDLFVNLYGYFSIKKHTLKNSLQEYPIFYSIVKETYEELGYDMQAIKVSLNSQNILYLSFTNSIQIALNEVISCEAFFIDETKTEEQREKCKNITKFFIGHELSHIKHRDVLSRRIGLVLPFIVAINGWLVMRLFYPVVADLFGYILLFAAKIGYFAFVRSQEKRADLESSQNPAVLRAGADACLVCFPTRILFSQMYFDMVVNLSLVHPISEVRAQYLRKRADELAAY